MNSLLGREPGRRSPLDRSRAIAACLIFPPFAKLDQGFHRAGTAPILPIAAQVAANNLKLQIATEKLRESSVKIDKMEFPVVEITDDGGKITTHVHVHARANCKTSTQTSAQTE